MKVEKNYTPEVLNFVLPEVLGVPDVLFPEVKDIDEARQQINTVFVAFNEGLTATRFMDEKEIKDTTDELVSLVSDEKPEHLVYLRTLESEMIALKHKVKEAEAEFVACQKHIDDLGAILKDGTTDFKCEELNTFKIPIGAKYVWYSFLNGKLQLVKVVEMTESEKTELFNACNNNFSQLLTLTTGEVPDSKVI